MRGYIAYWNKLQSETNLKMYILAFWRKRRKTPKGEWSTANICCSKGWDGGVVANVYLSSEGVIDGEGLAHHFLMARHKAFPLFEEGHPYEPHPHETLITSGTWRIQRI